MEKRGGGFYFAEESLQDKTDVVMDVRWGRQGKVEPTGGALKGSDVVQLCAHLRVEKIDEAESTQDKIKEMHYY